MPAPSNQISPSQPPVTTGEGGASPLGVGGELSAADRRMQKLIRNRESAKLHRDRQKHRLAHLEALTKQQEATIQDLKRQIELLRKENLSYKHQAHRCRCQKTMTGSNINSGFVPSSPSVAESSGGSDTYPDSSPGYEGAEYDSGSDFHTTTQEEGFPSVLPPRQQQKGLRSGNIHAIKIEQDPQMFQTKEPKQQSYGDLKVPEVDVKPEFERKPSIEPPPDLTEEDWKMLEDELFLPSIEETDFLQEMLEEGEPNPPTRCSSSSLHPQPQHQLPTNVSQSRPGPPQQQQRALTTTSVRRHPLSSRSASLGVTALFAVCCLLSIFSDPSAILQRHTIVEVSQSLPSKVPVGLAVYQSQDLVPYSSSLPDRKNIRHSRGSGRVLHTLSGETNSDHSWEFSPRGMQGKMGKDRERFAEVNHLSRRPRLWRDYVRKYHKAPWEYAKALDLYKSRELQLAEPGVQGPTPSNKALVAASEVEEQVAMGMAMQLKLVAANMALLAAAMGALPTANPPPDRTDTSYMFCPQAYGMMNSGMSIIQKPENDTSATPQSFTTTSKPGLESGAVTDEYMVLLVPTNSLDWGDDGDNYMDRRMENKSSYSWIEIGCKVVAARLIPDVHFPFDKGNGVY
mmetsp:Transcript_8353/g.11068  ORF Transcript_8353/g.11068 Transcript_8353/m.11068 type:complete len:626 (+) Transcript_8353:297-2174(+)